MGRVNKSIVALIEKCDGKAVGLCGKDAGLVKAEVRDFEALGYVGDVTSVDVTILQVGGCLRPRRVPNSVLPNPVAARVEPPAPICCHTVLGCTLAVVLPAVLADAIDVGSGQTLVDSGVIPVVATVASDKDGNALNINADTVAGEIAAGLGASKLILMTGATLALPLLCGMHCGSSTRSTFQHNA